MGAIPAMSSTDVLIVEDEHDLANLYVQQLDDAVETTVAYDGEEALDVLAQRGEELDVVLLDRRLPEMSGDEVLSAIRERQLGCAVAMVTAVTPDFDIVQLGFDEYLTKPVTAAELNETVERLAKRATTDDQIRKHLALVAKKRTLKNEMPATDLEDSDEYTQLEEIIAASREQTEAAVVGDVFVEVLREHTGDQLYTVMQYEEDGWEYRYVNDSAADLLAEIDPDLDEFVEQCRQEGRQKTRLNTLFDLNDYYCSLHFFDTVILINFYQTDNQGIVCGFNPDAAPNLNSFVSLIRPYVYHTDGES